MSILNIRVGGKKIKIKDCDGVSSFRGLMFDSLKGYKGALIHAATIWMPFVRHELDLHFLDRYFRIVKILRAVPVTLNPRTWRVYKCESASYCLELKAGSVKAKVGTKVTRL